MKKTLTACAVLLLLTAISQPAMGQDEPTIAKDTIVFKAWTVNQYRQSFDTWSWLPKLEYRVNGPIASGSQLYAEVTIPGGAPIKFDCPTSTTEKGYWWKTECGGRDHIPEEKGVLYVGPVSFTIKMKNELTGTNITLFSGKAKVAKVHSNEVGPKAINKWVYYVDQDWTLPIAYVFVDGSKSGWNLPTFHVAFWIRGEERGKIEPHLFYQGKEIGKQFLDGTEVGAPGCGSELDINPTHSVDEKTAPQKAKWSRMYCTYYNVRGWDKTGEKASGLFKPPHLLSANPGEYEFKVLWNGRLARTLKFTVDAEGKFDNGLASAFKLGTDRVIYPITILGDFDGAWDRLAWKAGAFYGNPVPGFTAAAAPAAAAPAAAPKKK